MTEEYTKIDNHVEIAQGRQVWQYKDGENWNALLEANVQRIQLLEDLLHQLLTERDLTNAVGAQLNLLGLDYNLIRVLGESDDDFRTRIRVEINLLLKAGQTDVLIFNLNRLVTPLTTSLRQVFPLKILMWIFVDDFGDITPGEATRINNAMQKVKAAGVGLSIGMQLNDSAFIPAPTIAGGAAGEGAATLLDGSDGGAFVKSII